MNLIKSEKELYGSFKVDIKIPVNTGGVAVGLRLPMLLICSLKLHRQCHDLLPYGTATVQLIGELESLFLFLCFPAVSPHLAVLIVNQLQSIAFGTDIGGAQCYIQFIGQRWNKNGCGKGMPIAHDQTMSLRRILGKFKMATRIVQSNCKICLSEQ